MSSYERAAATVGAGLVARAAATAVTTVGGFLVTVLAVRALGTERYGALAFGLAFTMLGAVAARVGLGGAVTREVAAAAAGGDPAAATAVVRAAWTTVVGAGTIAGVLTGVVSAAAPLEADLVGRPALGLGLGVLVVGVNVAAAATFVARGTRRMASAELPQVAIVIVQLLGFGWLAVRGGDGVAGAGLVLLVSGAAGLATGVVTIGRALPGVRWTPDPAGAARLLRRAAPFALAGIATQAIAQADVIALGLARGARVVGAYDPLLRTADRALLLAPALFLAGFVPAATALLTRGDHDAFEELYARAGTLAYAVATAPLALLAAFPQEVLGALFPDVPADVTVLRVLVAGYAVHLVFGLNTGALIAAGDRRRIAVAYAWSFAAAVLLVAVAVPSLGALGAALATSGSYLVMNVAVTLGAHGATGAHPFGRQHVVVVISSIGPIGIASWASAVLDAPSLPLAVGLSTVVWCAWIVALRAAGVLSGRDLRAFSPRAMR